MTTPQILAGSMPTVAVGSPSVGIFNFSYTGTGTLSIQTSLDGTTWHPASPISIQGASPTYANWTVGSGNQPYSVINITPTVTGTTSFYVRIYSVSNNTYSNSWFTSLTAFIPSGGGFGSYIQQKAADGTSRARVETIFVRGAANGGQHTRIVYATSGGIETNAQTFLEPFHHIVRYDGSGAVLWSRRANMTNSGATTMPQAVQDEAGNLYLLVYGLTLYVQNSTSVEQSFPGAVSTRHLIKLSSSGQFLWKKSILGTHAKMHIAVGGSVVALFTDQPASGMVYDGVASTPRENLYTSKVLIAASTETGAFLWSRTYNPASARSVDNDKLDVNNWGYVAVHMYATTSTGNWEGVALPTMAGTAVVCVFTNAGVLSYTTGVLSGGSSTPYFIVGSMYLKRSSSNVFVDVFYSSNSTFRVPSSNVWDTVTLNQTIRIELSPIGFVTSKNLTNSPGFSMQIGRLSGPDIGKGILTPWWSEIPSNIGLLTDGEVKVLSTRSVGFVYGAGNQNSQYINANNTLGSIIAAQFDEYGNAFITTNSGASTTSLVQEDLYVDLVKVATTTLTQPANFIATATSTGFGLLAGYPTNENPPANNATEPPTAPVCPSWPASVAEGQSASGVITGYDPEGLATTTTGQGTTVPVLQIWDPAVGNWSNDPASLVISGFGTISTSNSGLLNIGSTVTFTPESAKWYGNLGILCRWKVGNRFSSISLFTTAVVNTPEATDAPTGDLNDVFEGEIVQGTFQFTLDPDFKTSYTWELSPQHTKPGNWDTLYPPNQYPNNTQPDWHTTILQTINVKNNANETMGVATVLSTNHPAKSAVLRFTSLPGKTGSAKFDVRVNNGVGSPWTTVIFTVDARPIPTFVDVTFPTVFESSYSQAVLSFAHVYQGVDVSAQDNVSYEYEMNSDAGQPANWDTLYPPQNYPNGQPAWPVTWTASAQAIDHNDVPVGLVTVQSENDAAKTAVLRFSPVSGFNGTASFDLQVKATWPITGTRPVAVVKYSSVKSSTIQVTLLPVPGSVAITFPTVSESSYSQAQLSFSHLINGVNIPAGTVSYEYELTSDAGKPDNWDTLYPPANYPQGQPAWPVTWLSTANAIDHNDVPVGLVTVQSEDDANKTAILRFTPIYSFTGSASFDLQIKATWPVTATRLNQVVQYSSVKSSSIQITSIETPGTPSGSMPNANEDSTSTGTWTFTYTATQSVSNYDITWQLSPQTDKPNNWDTLYPVVNFPYGQPDWHTTTGTTVTVLDDSNSSIGTATILTETDAQKKCTIRFTPAGNWNGSASFDLRALVTWPVSAARPIPVTKYSNWAGANVTVTAQPDSPVLAQPVAPVTTEDTTSEFTISWTDVDKSAQQIAENGAANYKVILNTTGSGIGTDQEVITLSKAIVRVISYSPNLLQATLRVEPLANQTGSFAVYMRVQDDESASRFSSWRAVTINILSVPDAPTPVQGSMPFALNGQNVSGTFTTTDVDSTYSHFLIASSYGGTYVKTLTAGALTLNVVDSLTTDRQCEVQLLQTAAHSLTSYGFYIRAYDVASATYTTAGGLYSNPVFVSGQIGTAAQGSDTGGGGQIVTPGPGGSGGTGLWGSANGGTYIFPAAAGATTVTRLAPFTTITALSVTESLDGSGYCEMTVSASEVALRAAQANQTVQSYLKAGSVELTVNIGGSTFFVGVISETAWETDSGTVRITAQGLLSYFDNRIVPRTTNFVARNLSDIIADLIAGTQSFAYGDLAITSAVSQVSANATLTFQSGTTIGDAIGQVLDRVDAPEIWIGPDRVLRAEATRGVDNQSRVRISSGVASVASWTRRNDGIVTVAKIIGGSDGSGGFFSGSAGSVSGAQQFGLVEKQYELPALLSNGECTALAQRVVDSFNEEVSALNVLMTLTPDKKFYIADVGVGNVVTLDLQDPTLGQIFGAYRIINRSVTLVDTAVGTYDVSLDLEPAKYVSNKLIGSRSRHNPKLLTDSAKAELLLRQA